MTGTENNACSILKTKKGYAPNASQTILSETTLKVVGNTLEECEKVFNRLWEEKTKDEPGDSLEDTQG